MDSGTWDWENITDEDVEKLINKFKTVMERVEYILRNYPESRNDDFYLYILYLRLFDREVARYIRFIPLDVIRRATRPETVRRARQKIQEKGKYLPTDPKILKRRRRLSDTYRKTMVKL